MLYNGIFINSDNLIEIAYSVKKKIKEIEECYNAIITNVKQIDGSTEIWQCDSQKKFYSTISVVTDRYAKNINKLTEIYNFLCKVINDYEQKDENYGKELDRYADRFDV